MEIVFKTKKLRTLANDYNKCRKEMGDKRAKIFHRRLGELKSADSLEDVRYLPGNYHQLTGNYKGHWACNLDQPYRLIFRPAAEPPTDEHGGIITSQVIEVLIIKIEDYH